MPRLVLLVLLALPGVLVACGTEGSPSSSLSTPAPGDGASRLAAAPAATVAAGSARTTLTAAVTLAGAGERAFTGTGMIDFRARRGTTTIDLSSVLGDVSPEAPTLETIVDGDLVYVRSPLLDVLGSFETPWVRVDPSHGDLGQLGAIPSGDPLGPLSFLAGVDPSSVEDLGTEEVNGVGTTHLRASVDVAPATAAAGAADVGRLLAGLGAGQLTLDAYLDDGGRVRRLTFDHALPAAWAEGSQRFAIDYASFGVPVDIELPADDEVTDLDAVLTG